MQMHLGYQKLFELLFAYNIRKLCVSDKLRVANAVISQKLNKNVQFTIVKYFYMSVLILNV
jgi:hypothetical protein